MNDSKQETMISADALKKQIAKVKKCFRSDNNDYATGYISALSVVEGMIAYLTESNTIPESLEV
ncbi:hypothetical protein H9185_001186 [Listeria monocytogenes]|nr:hypothetical protein [Listeria monocytogenes]